MAELIPLEYRVSVARGLLVRHWIFIGALAVVACGAAVLVSYRWKSQRSAEYDAMQTKFQESANLLKVAENLQTARGELAVRMARVERLQKDVVLLSLLGHVASGFSNDDCLRFLRVEAHVGDLKADDSKYQVQIRGITRDDASHARLLDRLTDLGAKSQPPLKINIGEKHLGQVKDGEATFFDLTCEPLPAAAASANGN